MVRAHMEVSTSAQAAVATDADTIAVGIFEGEDPPQGLPAEAAALLSSGEARRTFKQLALAHADGRRWLLVGLGTRERFGPERARVAASLAAERAREISTRALAWEAPLDGEQAIAVGIVEGTILGGYRFERYKSRGDESDERPREPPPPIAR